MKVYILINCPDKSGIVCAVTGFIHSSGGNIIYLDQHVDKSKNIFFMRLESDFDASSFNLEEFRKAFRKELAIIHKMDFSIHTASSKPRMALFVSKYNHCLYDILSRFNSGELQVDIPFILSNHPDLGYISEQFNIPFYHVPFSKQNRDLAEQEQLKLLKEHDIDFIVLARYMQIVSTTLIDKFPNRIINIHHSFLPAFAGAKPYHAAFARGVKIIGATSHYVTEELDAGPIIEQDVTTVSHTHSIADFITKGRDLEKIVLSRALKLHIERKTMVYNNKTVVFS
ncbi:formyltetrahydrofolate deformylase [Maribacter sp. R77961]|uniref:formyltetrahydrofolate deformylase n=1 Tax=Maribacter sp. R77961 TaxID=3093871 RepID=UPI0037C86C0F